MRPPLILFAAASVVVVAAGCTIAPVDPAGLACDAHHACGVGLVCVEGACERACTKDAECAGGRSCIAGGCAVVVVADAGTEPRVDAGSATDGGTVVDAGRPLDAGPDQNAPTITAPPNPAATSHGERVSIPLSAADLDGDAISFVIVAAPLHGTAVGTATGVDYTPDPGFAGFDSAGVSAFDGQKSSAPVDVEIYTVGRSCAHVLTEGGSRGDGVYLFDTDPDAGPAPDGGTRDVDVLCDMSRNGGGWSLALKADGSKNTFCFGNALWTDESTLNPDDVTQSLGEAKLNPYNHVAAGELLIDTRDTSSPSTGSVEMPFGDGTSKRPLRDLIADAAFAGTTTTPIQVGAALFPTIPFDGLQDSNPAAGVNVNLNNGAQEVRIGAVGQSNDCGSKPNVAGVGIRNSSCGGPGGGLATVGAGGNTGCSDRAETAFAFVWVRSRDFTFLPPILSCDPAKTDLVLSGEYEVDLDGAGGAQAQPSSCDFGDFHRLIVFNAATDPCPVPLIPGGGGCIRDPASIPAGGPVSIVLPAPIAYHEVKATVRAHPIGQLDGFFPSTATGASVDGVYVDGISLTTSTTSSTARQHAFTFAAGAAGNCPCDGTGTSTQAPNFVGSNYVCDETDPLFDFNAVGPFSTCGTNADVVADVQVAPGSTGPVEVTIMTDQAPTEEDIALVELEVFVR